MKSTKADIMRRLTDAGLVPPRAVTMAITNRCNLQCRHCWPGSGPNEQAPMASRDQALRLIAEFAALGAEKLVITGGEPLIHPDWFDILEFACRQSGIDEVWLQTNAIMIKPRHVNMLTSLKDRGLSIQTSLEGATADAHDQVRGLGSFHQTWQGLRMLIQSGLARHICITFTEMQHNFEQIPKLMEMIDGMGIRRFVSGTLVCGGRAVESGGLSPPTPQQYEELLELFRQDPVFRERYHRIGNIAALEWDQDKTDHVDTCCTFIETPYVTAEGRLYPCVMLHADDYAATDVYTRSLTSSMEDQIESWSRLQRIKHSRITELDLCSGCRDYAKCGAGCMGRAYSAYEDFFAVEDRCRLRQAVYRRRTRLS